MNHQACFPNPCRVLTIVGLVALAISDPALGARKKDIPHPDFTRGDPIPEGATHDWTLGATGARGWIYSENLVTSGARQIRITKVAKGSPADGVLAVGDAAAPAVPEMLEMLAQGPAAEDPRNMQQRFFTFALFDGKGGGLSSLLMNVERDQLFKAVRAGLQNEDGRARGRFVSVYQSLSFEEIKPLLHAVLEAVRKHEPSGIMFADQIRMEGLMLLARHHIEEAMPACVEYLRTRNRWGSQKRSVELMAILQQYGVHAKAHIPELEKIAANFEKGEGDFPRQALEQKIKAIRDGIRTIQEAKDLPNLARIVG